MPHLMTVIIARISLSNCKFCCNICRCGASSCPIQRLLMTMRIVVAVVVIVVAVTNIGTTTTTAATTTTTTTGTSIVCCTGDRKRQVTCTRFHSVSIRRRQWHSVSKVAVYLLSSCATTCCCISAVSWPTNNCR